MTNLLGLWTKNQFATILASRLRVQFTVQFEIVLQIYPVAYPVTIWFQGYQSKSWLQLPINPVLLQIQ
jgi:hypothetical protein